MYFSFLYSFVWNISHSKKNSVRYHIVRMPSYNVPVILVAFLQTKYFLDRFSKNNKISNFIKICPVGAELFHADRLTDRHTDRQRDGWTDMKLIIVFRNFANALKNRNSRHLPVTAQNVLLHSTQYVSGKFY